MSAIEILRPIWRSVEPVLARSARIPDEAHERLNVVRDRLRRCRIEHSGLAINGLTERRGPRWFRRCGGMILAPPFRPLPEITAHDDAEAPMRPLVVIGRHSRVGSIIVWGEGPAVFVGSKVGMSKCRIACGGKSLVFIGDGVSSAEDSRVNARNGGTVYVRGDGLWGPNVRLNTDDMHAIRDAQTGTRVNPFGGIVKVDRHVWLGQDAMLLHGTHIGHDTIIGARSIVTKELPNNAVCVGSPARVIREGVTWTFADDP